MSRAPCNGSGGGGATGVDRGYGVSVANGGVYVTGYFNSTANFNTPSNPASNTLTSAGSNDVFLVKYDASGNLQGRRRGGSTLSDHSYAIAVSSTGVYVTRDFNGTANFNTPFQTGYNELTAAGGADLFLVRFPFDLNNAPVATANANQTATVGRAFSYTVNAFTDADTPNSLTYAASLSPANGLSFDATTRVISGTPLSSAVSSVTITATDGGGLSRTTSFSISSLCSLTASITPSSSTLTCGSSTVSLTASGGDTYRWSTGENAAQITVNSAATYSVTVTAASGCTATATTTIVSTTTAPPVAIAATPGLTIAQGQSAQLSASGADAYRWSTGETSAAISVSLAGTYSVTGTTGVCSATSSATLTVSAPPGLTLATWASY